MQKRYSMLQRALQIKPELNLEKYARRVERAAGALSEEEVQFIELYP